MKIPRLSRYARLKTPEKSRECMEHLRTYQIKKVGSKEEAIARQRERKRVEEEWRDAIQGVIDQEEAVTADVVAALLGVNPSPQTPHERTQFRQLSRRLQRGADHSRYRALYEYNVLHNNPEIPKHRMRTHAGRAFYISLDLSKKEGLQFQHKALITRVRSTLHRAIAIDAFKTDIQLRDEAKKGDLIYDHFARVGTRGWCIEVNRSDKPVDMSAKCRRWFEEARLTIQAAEGIRALSYVWFVTTQRRADNLLERWQADGLTEWNFLVGCLDDFNVFDPASILQPLFRSPADTNLHSLME
jgi:hypothetical protein